MYEGLNQKQARGGGARRGGGVGVALPINAVVGRREEMSSTFPSVAVIWPSIAMIWPRPKPWSKPSAVRSSTVDCHVDCGTPPPRSNGDD